MQGGICSCVDGYFKSSRTEKEYSSVSVKYYKKKSLNKHAHSPRRMPPRHKEFVGKILDACLWRNNFIGSLLSFWFLNPTAQCSVEPGREEWFQRGTLYTGAYRGIDVVEGPTIYIHERVKSASFSAWVRHQPGQIPHLTRRIPKKIADVSRRHATRNIHLRPDFTSRKC